MPGPPPRTLSPSGVQQGGGRKQEHGRSAQRCAASRAEGRAGAHETGKKGLLLLLLLAITVRSGHEPGRGWRRSPASHCYTFGKHAATPATATASVSLRHREQTQPPPIRATAHTAPSTHAAHPSVRTLATRGLETESTRAPVLLGWTTSGVPRKLPRTAQGTAASKQSRAQEKI